MADQVIQSTIEWIGILPPIGVYFLFTLISYLENVLPPIPGDVLIAFSGYLAAEGLLSLPLIWILTVLASVIGFMNMYWIGAKLGGQINEKKDDHLLLKFINYQYFTKGKIWMNKYGQWVIFGNRFLAGTRSVISLTAGMSHLKVSTTILNSLISSMLWNAALLIMGWLVRDNWHIIGGYLSSYGKVILVCISTIIISRYLWTKMIEKRTAK